jgi:trk system potassium uptake protein TrkA
MKAVVVGCGRVGAGVADELDRAGWQVLIIDLKSAAFDRLPATFAGTALRGDGTDEDVLRRAGAENADLFLALTEGDNRNIMAAQLGIEALAARKTVAKVNDPVRAEAYAHLGIATLCRTNLMTSQILGYSGQSTSTLPGIYVPKNPHQHAIDEGALPASPSADTPGTTAGGVATGAGGTPVDPIGPSSAEA